MEAEAYFGSLGYASPARTIHIMDYMLDQVIGISESTLNVLIADFQSSNIKVRFCFTFSLFCLQESESEFVSNSTWPDDDTHILKFRPSFLQQVR